MKVPEAGFVGGVISGAASSLAVVLALVAVGVLDTGALYVTPAATVQAWDTRGSADRSEWRPINRRADVVPSARHLVVENGAVTLRWAGTPAEPGRFDVTVGESARATTVAGRGSALPSPPAVGGFDPPARLRIVSNVELRIEVGAGDRLQRTLVRAGEFGYGTELTTARADEAAAFDLGAYVPPFALSDGEGVVTAALDRRRGAKADAVAGRGYTLAGTAPASRFFVVGEDAATTISADRAGFVHRARVAETAVDGRLRAFIGVLPGEPGVPALLMPARGLRSPAPGWLVLARRHGRWRPAEDAVGAAEAAIALPATGDGATFERLASAGVSALAAL